MGLLDNLVSGAVGSMLGGAQQGAAPGTQPQAGAGGGTQALLMQAALTLLQQSGGVQGVIDKFRQAGLGQHVDAWVSTGPNPPVSGDQVQQALGTGPLANVASQLGMNHGDLASGIAQVLPGLIDKFTPNGSVPDNHHDLISQGLQMLQGMGGLGGLLGGGAAPAPKPAGT